MASSSGKYNPARPKRDGDHFTSTHHLDAGEPSAKKPRFDPRNRSTFAQDADEDEDPALEADAIGKGAGTKRNGVKTDSYDSDSSTENFNARAETKSKKIAPNHVDGDDIIVEEDKDKKKDKDTR